MPLPADYTSECTDEHPMEEATATDNCGDVIITLEESTTTLAIVQVTTCPRTFTATDVVTHQALLRLLQLCTTGPNLLPADYEVEVNELYYEDATATDACSTVIELNLQKPTQSLSEELRTYLIHRIFTAEDDVETFLKQHK